MNATIKAVWSDNFKKGSGIFSSVNPLMHEMNFHFMQRPNKKATLPEELLAAAYSSCFSMTLAMLLTKENFTINRIETECNVEYNNDKVTNATLSVHSNLSDKIDEIKFKEIATQAKELCPISKGFNFPTQLNVLFE